MKVADLVACLESLAPPILAEDWDNVGLLVGDLAADVNKVMVCMDLTEPVLAEAIRAKAQLVLTHHPLIFKSVSRVTACEAPVVYDAVRQGLAVYSAHTNLDSAVGGTNDVLADVLDLEARRPLEPTVRQDQCKVVTFAPPEGVSAIAEAAFSAGAGRVGNYRDCAFFCHGIGSFYGQAGAHPVVGRAGRHEVAEELRLEVVCPRGRAAAVREAMRGAHPYEEPVIDVYVLEDLPAGCGMGRIGRLRRPATVGAIITRLKKATGAKSVLLSAASTHGGPHAGRARSGDGQGLLVTTAACCSGAGGSCCRKAVAQGATLLVTGELSYHDALDASARGLTVVALGHGYSERIAIARLGQRLAEAVPKLAVVNSTRDQDPFVTV
jgi:dinuclear metal center YbgI/SA1388 family protein